MSDQDSPAHIIVGYDGSPDADAALVWAVESSRLEGHELRVLIMGSAMDPAIGHFREQEDLALENLRTEAHRRLRDLAVDAPVVEVKRGPVVPGLLQAASGSAMLIVGSAGHSLAAGTLTGSVSQHVARHASCPVVVVRPRRSPHARRIVVGIDGSAESARALRFACDRAQHTGEVVVAAHGSYSASLRWLRLDDAAAEPVVRRMAAAEKLAASEVSGLAADFPGVEMATETALVRPADLLVACSAAASLVVVGSRGRDAFAEMLLGSTSQHVLHHAQCPVAVVR